jgi:ubiquinone/menaquinone biosynthesis C-methylase UbiE
MTAPSSGHDTTSQSHSEADTDAASRGPVFLDEHQVEDADIHASSYEYSTRFSSRVGQWMLAVQEEILLAMLDPDYRTVLDIGGGHGQTALPIAQAKRSVTVLGSSPVCALRLKKHIESGLVGFSTGNLINPPYPQESFDLVVSFRLMSHCTNWRTLIAQMCRVSHRAVIIDYPVWMSVNLLSPLLFSLKRRVEGNTRTYRLFSTREIVEEFRKHGFVLAQEKKQFVWPMALHRILNAPQISRLLEGLTAALWLTRLFGSPVIAKFVRE